MRGASALWVCILLTAAGLPLSGAESGPIDGGPGAPIGVEQAIDPFTLVRQALDLYANAGGADPAAGPMAEMAKTALDLAEGLQGRDDLTLPDLMEPVGPVVGAHRAGMIDFYGLYGVDWGLQSEGDQKGRPAAAGSRSSMARLFPKDDGFLDEWNPAANPGLPRKR